ncbi:MAG: hypothetical protein GQ469_09575 [Methanosarcinales archaeon]|nr:hypothetical protein [Methanosarcinales archaeon]
MKTNKEFNKYISMVVNILIILIFVSSICTVSAVNVDETKTIDMYGWLEIPINDVEIGDILDVDIQVTSGGSVDVLLMDAVDYVNYMQDIDLEYYVDGSAEDVKSKKYSFTFDNPGDYYLVVDNDDVYGLANPIGSVDIHYKLSISTPTPTSTSTPSPTPTSSLTPEPTKSPGFGMFMVVFALCFAMVFRKW